MITQTSPVTKTLFANQTIGGELYIGGGVVRVDFVFNEARHRFATLSAAVGSPTATTLLSYLNQSTGQLTPAGETAALSQPIDGMTETLSNFFTG